MLAGLHENPSCAMWEGSRERSYWILTTCDAASDRRGKFKLPHSFDDLPWLCVVLLRSMGGKSELEQSNHVSECEAVGMHSMMVQ